MKQPTTPWQTATIIGSVWGAFEVVAGSILHNIAVPMVAGTLLSAIGVMIMVTGARVFGGKGIFWRSALVCAALKTVSPSPVILTPMLGITLEGLLMEVGVLALGQNIAGYMVGGGLAVVSIIGFKLVRLIMIYGTNLVDAYKSFFSFAFSNEFLNEKGYLIPLLLLIFIYFLFGALAAIMGYRGGNEIKKRFSLNNIQFIAHSSSYKPTMKPGQYKGGLIFLIFHIVWLVAFIGLKGVVPIFFWLTGGILYILICMFRYGRVRALSSKILFWIVIFVVSVVSSILITLGKNNTLEFNSEIVILGLSIFIRASVVIISFTSIGIEVMSKGVSRHFKGGMFKPLVNSYSHAHNALPHLISTLKGNSKNILKPIPLIEGMFSQFSETATKKLKEKKIYIVTADKHAGKTTFIKELVAQMEISKKPYSGFFAESIWDINKQHIGYKLVTLPSQKEVHLCNRTNTSWNQFGSFYFNPNAVKIGNEILEYSVEGSIIFIDEIGRFELDGNLWADAFSKLVINKKNTIIIAVRRLFLDEVIQKWNLSNAIILDATTDCTEDLVQLL
jgi:nucleoside-triphosphatase THEP1